MKKFIVIVLSIIYTPILLFGISHITSFSCDVELNGYTDSVEKPQFKIENFLNGEFQEKCATWIEQKIKPRGLLVKTYSSIRYNIFNLGNKPIGYNKDIFEWKYIASELCIDGEKNLKNKENQEEMKSYIYQLESVQKKLEKYDKKLYIYIAPSKADFEYNDILNKYKKIQDQEIIKPVDFFEQEIRHTDLKYKVCKDEKDNLEYPAFYTTGIHWSRTFEQTISQQIVDELSKITGKNYRKIILGNVVESDKPYWRDADVYDLLNVWNNIKNTKYYEFEEEREEKESYDKMKILIQGDSFGQGLIHDISMIYPYEDIYFISRNNYLLDKDENQIILTGWDSFDISSYLDQVDTVVIEMTEAELTNYSSGFVDYLDKFLDTYNPKNEEKENFAECVDANNDDAWETDSLRGVYYRENGFAWANDYSQVILKNNKISNQGIKIVFDIPEEVFKNDTISDIVSIYVNGKFVKKMNYLTSGEQKLYIDYKQIPHKSDVYNIEIYCSKKFNPKEMGNNSDDRDLAIRIKYIGN